MAIYEYECKKCGEKFELRRKMTEHDEDIGCPRCKTLHPKRILSVFSGYGSTNSCGPVPGASGGG